MINEFKEYLLEIGFQPKTIRDYSNIIVELNAKEIIPTVQEYQSLILNNLKRGVCQSTLNWKKAIIRKYLYFLSYKGLDVSTLIWRVKNNNTYYRIPKIIYDQDIEKIDVFILKRDIFTITEELIFSLMRWHGIKTRYLLDIQLSDFNIHEKTLRLKRLNLLLPVTERECQLVVNLIYQCKNSTQKVIQNYRFLRALYEKLSNLIQTPITAQVLRNRFIVDCLQRQIDIPYICAFLGLSVITKKHAPYKLHVFTPQYILTIQELFGKIRRREIGGVTIDTSQHNCRTVSDRI